MTTVEMGQKYHEIRLAQLFRADTDVEVEETDAPDQVRLHRAADPTVAVCGIRYQRCGGGRRVIRKKTGGD